MIEVGLAAVLLLTATTAILALLAYLRVRSLPTTAGASLEQTSQLVRMECEVVRKAGDEQSRLLRQELTENLRGFQEATLNMFRELGTNVSGQIKEFGNRLDVGVKTIDDRTIALSTKVDEDITKMGVEAGTARDVLRLAIEQKLDASAAAQALAAQALREEMTGSFGKLGANVREAISDLGLHQKERLENVTAAVTSLTEKQTKAQEALKETVEARLDTIRTENAAKLEEMRQTVDEKLQSTLETRLGESFNRVVEHLERVHKGIGEMQSLAAGVGDLKKVLTNVRVRGTFGEAQLGQLLDQFLSPEQFIRNAQIKDDTQERVEFAIRLPGRDDINDVLLPVDAKFPHEDYDRLVVASEAGDVEAVAAASKDLENRVRQCAKAIKEKYLAPPRTTDFGILFLPTEALYAEVLRRPGFFEQLQREFHVTLTGPTTFTALLNALQMGFRSLAIEKRSSEVWQILGAVRNEFGKYNTVVDRLSKQLLTASNSVKDLGVRTRAMDRKLRDVEKLPDTTAEILLGPSIVDVEQADDEAALAEAGI